MPPLLHALNDYDEFVSLREVASELSLPTDNLPNVERGAIETGAGEWLSYLRWGSDDPELVFLHGGGQNAHTWDYVALALGRSAIAFDLPGHGHSYRRADGNYGPWNNTDVLAQVVPVLAPNAAAVIGMSLGGATLIRFAAAHPDICRKAVIVDVTPQVNDPSRSFTTMERGSVALISGPPTYASLEEMADAAVALSPFRSAAGVRRGVRHNAYQRADGRWAWRYDLGGPRPEGQPHWSDFTSLWDDASTIRIPTMLVLGGESKYVSAEDRTEMEQRIKDLRVEVVPGAGHAVQSDRPMVLVDLINTFVF